MVETMDSGNTAIIVAITGALSVIFTKLSEVLWNYVAHKRNEQSKMEAHLEKRISRLEEENARCERRVTRMWRNVRILENSNTQMRAYIHGLRRSKGVAPYEETPLSEEELTRGDAEDSGMEDSSGEHRPASNDD